MNDSTQSRPSTDPLAESFRIQAGAAQRGFDWPEISGAIEKVREELAEIEQALAENDPAQARTEFGDLLFSVVNVSRFLRASPSDELRRAIDRFVARFAKTEAIVNRAGKRIEECDLAELDRAWEEAKSD